MRTPPPPPPDFFLPSRRISRGLALALVAGPWREDDLVSRAARALAPARGGRWLRPMVRRLLAALGNVSRPAAARVAAFLTGDVPFQRECAVQEVREVNAPHGPPVMWSAPGPPSTWDVPALATTGDLASWLGLSIPELDGFADLQGRHRRIGPSRIRHYDYVWRPKASGTPRLIEAPRRRLKALQRRVLSGVLDAIPPHEAAHGFRAGRSVRTFATPHVGQRVVLRFDLRDFFPSVTGPRVVALFLAAGYPEAVARRLAGLCTHRVPRSVWGEPGSPSDGPDARGLRRLYTQPHLPQGAPTSPSLANLAAYRLDVRLAAFAAASGGIYTRYADDLVVSGGERLARSADRFVVGVGATALEEGFEVNYRKTRVMRRGVRQRVAGVVVNDRPNVPRDDYDRLKATLHNCVKHGPEGQNRDAHADFRAHLTGRVAHVAMLNPARGERLRALLRAVEWGETRSAAGSASD